MTKTKQFTGEDACKWLDAARDKIPNEVSAFLTLRPEFIPEFGNQFLAFLDAINAKLPKLSEILAAPNFCRVPQDTHYQYVVAAGISRSLDPKNPANVAKYATYLGRMEKDIA